MFAARPESADTRLRVTLPAEATALVDSVVEQLSALAHVVGEETQLVRDGKLAEALEREVRKSELAGAYMKGLEQVKANAVALARFSPDGVVRLKAAHLEFQELIETNQAVLATARAVSESIVRDLAAQTGTQTRASGYGPTAAANMAAFRRPAAGPMMVSKRL
ncbi:MAG: hypothetical protein ACRDBH_07050 [Bosea sp. (in: a-proteobacteria)]